MDTQFYYKSIENQVFIAAKSRVQRLKEFYIYLFIYGTAATIYVLQTYFAVQFSFLQIRKTDFFLIMLIWTGIIGIRTMKFFIGHYLLGHQWEERKIQEVTHTNKLNRQ